MNKKSLYELAPQKFQFLDKKLTSTVFGLALGALALIGLSHSVFAMGPKKPVAVAPVPIVDSEPFPTRYLELGAVSTSLFHTPDGKAVDLGIDLARMVDTAVNQSEKFRTVTGGHDVLASLGRHGVLSAALTAVELEVADIQLKFGYTPGGEVGATPGPSPSASPGGVTLVGKVDIKVGNISMDYKVVDSDTGLAYGAVYVNHSMVTTGFSFKVDFGPGFSIGPEVQIKQALAPLFRTMTAKAMVEMAKARDINFIPWQARVSGIDADRRLVLMSEGVRAGLHQGNLFDVYSSCSTPGCLERYAGGLRVTRPLNGDPSGANPNGYSETVLIDPQNMNLDGIHTGDKVFIHYMRGF